MFFVVLHALAHEARVPRARDVVDVDHEPDKHQEKHADHPRDADEHPSAAPILPDTLAVHLLGLVRHAPRLMGHGHLHAGSARVATRRRAVSESVEN